MRGEAARYLRQERDVTNALAERGIDVTTPTDLVNPGPHTIGSRAFLLLGYRQLDPVDLGSNKHAEAVGRSLAALVKALAQLPHDLTRVHGGHPWAEIATLVDTVGPTTDNTALDRISSSVDELQATEPDDPWQLVHGDAHRVNVALSQTGVVWFDFEDSNRRPLAWDLATLRRAWPRAGDVACELLDIDPVSPSMLWHHELRDVYALLWNLLFAQRYERARKPTAERLQSWLTNH